MTYDLKREFDKRRPWVTKFVVQGEAYGGSYDLTTDVRLRWFQQHFPDAHRILELGSLEGGHSFALAAFPNVTHVVAVEGRKANFKRAQFVQHTLGESKVQFLRANLETLELSRLGQFDVVFCVGLLYHLPRPWKLIEQISRVAPAVFLWTHYAEAQKARKVREHYQGTSYREWYFFFEARSGLSPVSFWPTRASLLQMLADSGFGKTTVIDDNPVHEHGPGPAITLVARQG